MTGKEMIEYITSHHLEKYEIAINKDTCEIYWVYTEECMENDEKFSSIKTEIHKMER